MPVTQSSLPITVVATLARAWTGPPSGDGSYQETGRLIRGQSLLIRRGVAVRFVELIRREQLQAEQDEHDSQDEWKYFNS